MSAIFNINKNVVTIKKINQLFNYQNGRFFLLLQKSTNEQYPRKKRISNFKAYTNIHHLQNKRFIKVGLLKQIYIFAAIKKDGGGACVL